MLKSLINISLKTIEVLVGTDVEIDKNQYKQSDKYYGTDENGSPILMVSPLGFKKEN